jgi:predicted O-methyltransferase YrrM
MSVLTVAERCLAAGAMQKLSELARLLELLAQRPPRTVVEVGTAAGGTLLGWCAVSDPDATVISIDLPGGPYGGDAYDLTQLRSYGQLGQRLHFLPRDSHDIATRDALLELLAGRDVDFLHIDGDHTYDGARTDYELYAPLVAPSGVIAFHDILPHPAAPEIEVHRLWQEVRADGAHVEFVDPDDDRGWGQWGGYGVLLGPAWRRADDY